jgi:hypothetical protein
MGIYHHPSIGTFHLQEVQPRRVVPGHERHQWDSKPKWGESATCKKCGCVKLRLKTQPDYTERYQLAGTTQLLTERPPCTGPAAPAPPPAPPVQASTASPAATPASTTPPYPTSLPGLTTTYDEPAPYRHD